MEKEKKEKPAPEKADLSSVDEATRADQLEKAERALAEREAAVAKREWKAAAVERLSERKLPAQLIDCVDFSSEQSFEASFKAVCTSFSEAVSRAMSERVHTGAPKKIPGGASDAFLEGLGILK